MNLTLWSVVPLAMFWTQVRSCIGYPCQWLTHCCLEDLADVTLAFEDANSKRLAVADVDAEERVDDNLVKFWSWGILNLVCGHNIEAEVWSRCWSIFLVKTLRLRFGQAFEAEVRLRFWSWILINLCNELKEVTLMRALSTWFVFGNVYFILESHEKVQIMLEKIRCISDLQCLWTNK